MRAHLMTMQLRPVFFHGDADTIVLMLRHLFNTAEGSNAAYMVSVDGFLSQQGRGGVNTTDPDTFLHDLAQREILHIEEEG